MSVRAEAGYTVQRTAVDNGWGGHVLYMIRKEA